MRVVQINCAASGSTGKIAKAIHYALLAQGDESYIFYGLGRCGEKNMIRIGNDFDLHLHAVLSRNLGRQGYFSHFATKKLIRQIKSIDPDVIHLHNLHGSYLNLPMFFRFLRTSRAKILITLHDCWLFTGKCPHFTLAACERWKKECGKCPQLSSYPKSKWDRTEKCLTDKKKWLSGFDGKMQIIAVSNWLRTTAEQSFLSRYPIKTIYNGIDTRIFRHVSGERIRKKYGLEGKYLILGVSSVWNDQKGLNDFLEISELLKENEKIVLIGLAKNQLEQMPQNIIGISRTENQQELAEWYSAADIFINSSKEETFGLVTAEAMACGTPAAVYNTTACAEIVDPAFGYILSPGEKLRDHIRTIIEEKKNAPVGWKYTTEHMAEQYIKAYQH